LLSTEQRQKSRQRTSKPGSKSGETRQLYWSFRTISGAALLASSWTLTFRRPLSKRFMIRVYDDAGNVIGARARGEFKEP
jgi:hypothetical protein